VIPRPRYAAHTPQGQWDGEIDEHGDPNAKEHGSWVQNLAVVLVLPMPSTLTLQRRDSLQEHCVAVAGHRGDAMTRLMSEEQPVCNGRTSVD
jgi:hypothetical protein